MMFELAGGLFPEGRADFDWSDIQAAGPKYEALWVRLKSGVTYYISRRYEGELRVRGFL
jgi:hypothetical protein